MKYTDCLYGKDMRILQSLNDYRGWKKDHCGLFLTSGPDETIMSMSSLIVKNHSKVGEDLRKFLEKNRGVQLVFDDGYANSLIKELYDMLTATDGAANFDNGYLTAVKRHIEGVIGTGTIEGGARHKAAAYASKRGLTSYVLSEETGIITVFAKGEPRLVVPKLEDEIHKPLSFG
jgi:hypothetical protein